MKILQLGKFYPIRGGVEKVMYDLMCGLSRRGVQCDMMCAESHGHGVMRTLDANASIHSFHTWAKIASTTIAPSMITGLRSIAGNYDIIHIHHPDPMAAAALLYSGYEGPVVLHWHSDIIKSKALLSVYKPLQDWLLNRADVIVGTSPAYLEHSTDINPYRDKTVCIPIGVSDMEEDTIGADTIRNRYSNRKIIFSLGRLVPYKGYHHLIKAATMLPDDYVVLIGGNGPLHNSLIQMRDSLRLHDKVHFLGRIPEEQITAYYTACHIFCLPSVMKTEAFGIVQIEAMSLGKPIVATTIEGSGTAWVNQSGVSGINVEPGNPEELALAIRSIGDNPDTYSVLSDGAKARFRAEFTLDSMVNKCYNLYYNLITNQSSKQ